MQDPKQDPDPKESEKSYPDPEKIISDPLSESTKK
jgi:hypothetical protein